MSRSRDPFDALRATRQLAPHDPKLNDLRWLTGDALRRLHARAHASGLRAVNPGAPVIDRPLYPRVSSEAEASHRARETWRAAENRAGPHAWPIVLRIVIEGGHVRECRRMVPEFATTWRADCVVIDRLRVALDALGPIVGVTAARRAHG